METKLVMNFKQGNYPEGILAGVEALAVMAEKGVENAPPEKGLFQKASDYKNKAVSNHLLSEKVGPNVLNLAFWLGVILIIISLFAPKKYKKMLLIAGIALVVVVSALLAGFFV